jgi:catechol 2,3-dioxygenase-like lactoylglutathione lyase family enzyme
VPTIRRVLETALYCEQLSVTTEFFRTLLGAEPMLATERITAFDAGAATVLLLFQRGQSLHPVAVHGGALTPHDGSGPVHMAFAIDREELGAWEARLAELGIEVESTVRWEQGGVSLYFRDPDNHSIELATPGVWATY